MTPTSELVLYPVCLALGYLIGSFPTAYLLVKWRRRLDIRSAGTGNVGAMNAYDVTHSTALGVLVLLVDLAKGAVAATLVVAWVQDDLWAVGCAGIGAVGGHNFSPWLKFRGGRGLATAAGVMLVLSWGVVVVWGCVWAIHFAASRNLHGANIVATAASPLLLLVLPADLTGAMLARGESPTALLVTFSAMCALILVRHIGYFRTTFSPIAKRNG